MATPEVVDDNTTSLTIRGKLIVIGRLNVTTQTNLFFDELAPKLFPLLGEAMDRLGPLYGYGRMKADVQGLGLGTLMDRLVRELPAARFTALATSLLAKTTYNGEKLMPQVDVVLRSTKELLLIVLKALEFMYSDFYEGLDSLPFLVRLREKYASEASKKEASTPSSSAS